MKLCRSMFFLVNLKLILIILLSQGYGSITPNFIYHFRNVIN